MRPLHLFFRKEGFYPVEGINNDAELLDHVRLNPGTIRVENAVTGEIVWPPTTEDVSRSHQ